MAGTNVAISAVRQRVRFWAALAILSSLLSSPAAAEAVFSRRGDPLDENSSSEAAEDDAVREETFATQVMDADGDQGTLDLTPSARLDSGAAAWAEKERRRLRDFRRRATSLKDSADDTKLARLEEIVVGLLDDGFNPIIFCRFIDTAEYVATSLWKRLSGRYPELEIQSVTGRLPEEDRRKQVEELGKANRRLLVATDCLSEGINLQEHFDAVLHFDLP